MPGSGLRRCCHWQNESHHIPSQVLNRLLRLQAIAVEPGSSDIDVRPLGATLPSNRLRCERCRWKLWQLIDTMHINKIV